MTRFGLFGAIGLLGLMSVLVVGLAAWPNWPGEPIDVAWAWPDPGNGEEKMPRVLPEDVQAKSPVGLISAVGSKLVDAEGHEVRLTGVNWFGLETGSFAPHGLWARNWQELLDQTAAMGANTIRLPFSNQLLDQASKPNGIDYRLNPDLVGLNGLEIMDRVIAGAGARGLRVILDRHRPGADGQSELWYTDRYPEERWIADWRMLARRYRDNGAVIGADLHNEPHGAATWGSGDIRTDWRLAAERAGNAILAENPSWLIFVEGVESFGNNYYWWGGNLKGAAEMPVRLDTPGRLVYSAHDYGPGVYNQSWFLDAAFPANLPSLWDAHWGYLARLGRAPVLMGEFGGRSVGEDREGVWQRALVTYLRDNGLSYTYWALNPNSGDTGGLLEDDWLSPATAKQALLNGYQWSQFAALQPGGLSHPIVAQGEARSGIDKIGLDQQASRDRTMETKPLDAGTSADGPESASARDRVLVANGQVKARMRAGRREVITNNPAPELELVNTDTRPVPLGGLSLKYWLRTASKLRQTVDVDWASPGREHVRAQIVAYDRDDQSHFLAISFEASSGVVLQPGDSVEIKLRFHLEDWSSYDQSQHYSFTPLERYSDWEKVTVYQGERLIWGREPGR